MAGNGFIAVMRAHVLQHVPFEGPGSIADWLRDRNAAMTATKFFADRTLPGPEEVDLLVVMGGPMSVHDEADHPWLATEKGFLRAVIRAGKPVLGICLGAQLIAAAMGATVRRNEVKEIGWFPVDGSPTLLPRFRFPDRFTAFHWHGETFDLPEGSIPLASTPTCGNQAFQLGTNVIGLQFHLETTPESAMSIIENCLDEIVPGATVQTAPEMLAAKPEDYRAINTQMERILDYLAYPARRAKTL